MTCGEKIKRIRIFRGMTQKQLGISAGLGERNASIRIAQYESDSRIPRQELLDKIAQALNVNRLNFYTLADECAEDFMQTLFWLEESSRDSIRLFHLVRNPGKPGTSDDTSVRYNDNGDWPAQPPVGMYFQYGPMDEFLQEWLLRRQELRAGEITRDEYFEWKLNWPGTCESKDISYV